MDKEKKLFELLDREVALYSTPMPNKLLELPLKCEIYGLMSRLICESFANMRSSNGESNWECNAMLALGRKVSEKRVMTLNCLRKYLMTCQGANLIEYAKEVGGEITIKVNVLYIFEECPAWKN